MLHERNLRSIVKSITWRVLVIVSDLVIVYAVTRRYNITLAVVTLSHIVSAALYFTHERLWDRIQWGREV